jgi:hypothetical protein
MFAIVAISLAVVKGILAKEKYVLVTCKPSLFKAKGRGRHDGFD